VIAVGDVLLEIALQITLRGTVRELAAFMETLTSSDVVIGIGGQLRTDGPEGGKTIELCTRFGVCTGDCGR